MMLSTVTRNRRIFHPWISNSASLVTTTLTRTVGPLLIATLVTVALSACSSSGPEPERKPTEIPSTTTAKHSDLPADQLFENGKKYYYAGLYTLARESFEALRDNYSPGPYAEFAEIKLADTHFESREYDVAGQLYEDFLKNRPLSRSVPYVLYRAGRSYELSNKGVGRDAGPLEKAREYYRKLIDQYPDSVFADQAREQYVTVVQKLAEYEQFVMAYYVERELPGAVEARAKLYEKTWEPLVREAELEKRAYKKSLPPKPTGFASPNGNNSSESVKAMAPSSEESLPATTLSAPMATTLKQEGFQSPAPIPVQNTEYRVEQVECEIAGTPNIVLYLNKDSGSVLPADDGALISVDGGMVKLTLRNTSSRDIRRSCFNKDDLAIASNGEVSLTTQYPARVLLLKNPPRVLLALEGGGTE